MIFQVHWHVALEPDAFMEKKRPILAVSHFRIKTIKFCSDNQTLQIRTVAATPCGPSPSFRNPRSKRLHMSSNTKTQ